MFLGGDFYPLEFHIETPGVSYRTSRGFDVKLQGSLNGGSRFTRTRIMRVRM